MIVDPVVRRVECTAAMSCAAMAAIALAVAGGRPGPALGVVGGWVLIEVGYRAIVSGIDAMVEGLGGADPRGGDPAGKRRRVMAAAAKVSGRYALLALLAYVMIARLRLHPVGLIAGASSAVVAVSVEAVRVLAKK